MFAKDRLNVKLMSTKIPEGSHLNKLNLFIHIIQNKSIQE